MNYLTITSYQGVTYYVCVTKHDFNHRDEHVVQFHHHPDYVGKPTLISYYVSTFNSITDGVNLDGGSPNSCLNQEDVDKVKEFIKQQIEGEGQ